MNSKKGFFESGFTLIEVIVSLAIISILIVTFIPILTWMISRSQASANDMQASLLLQEAMEVGYNVMTSEWDEDWSKYPIGIYHPAVDVSASPNTWVFLPDGETNLEARYLRQIEIKPVCRNQGNGNILPSTCDIGSPNLDDKSKLLVATVNWIESDISKSISAQLLVIGMEAEE